MTEIKLCSFKLKNIQDKENMSEDGSHTHLEHLKTLKLSDGMNETH